MTRRSPDFAMAELAAKTDLSQWNTILKLRIALLCQALEILELKLTLRFGAMMVVWVIAALAILKLT
jgi:hypothetical protein